MQTVAEHKISGSRDTSGRTVFHHFSCYLVAKITHFTFSGFPAVRRIANSIVERRCVDAATLTSIFEMSIIPLLL